MSSIPSKDVERFEQGYARHVREHGEEAGV